MDFIDTLVTWWILGVVFLFPVWVIIELRSIKRCVKKLLELV